MCGADCVGAGRQLCGDQQKGSDQASEVEPAWASSLTLGDSRHALLTLLPFMHQGHMLVALHELFVCACAPKSCWRETCMEQCARLLPQPDHHLVLLSGLLWCNASASC